MRFAEDIDQGVLPHRLRCFALDVFGRARGLALHEHLFFSFAKKKGQQKLTKVNMMRMHPWRELAMLWSGKSAVKRPFCLHGK